METVYDYNVTAEELEALAMIDKRVYLKNCTEVDANLDLARLFYIRNDKERAEHYADKLPPNDKNDFWRSVTHP